MEESDQNDCRNEFGVEKKVGATVSVSREAPNRVRWIHENVEHENDGQERVTTLVIRCRDIMSP